jgi:ABC-type transport system substrate-binding protein
MFFYLSWLAKDQPIADPRVRRALALAVDHDAIIKGVLLGQGERSLPFGVFPGASFADPGRPSQKPIGYDPGRARDLLRDAGHAQGFELKLYSLSISGAPYLPATTEVVAANWGAIGVRTRIIPIEFGALRPMFTARDKALVGAATSFRYPAILTASFSCDARGVLRSRGPQPLLESPKVDSLCDEALGAATPEQAAEKMKLVFDEVDREVPMFTIAYANALYAVDPRHVGPWTAIESFLDLGPVYETVRRVR